MSHRDELFAMAEEYCHSQNWHYDVQKDRYQISFNMRLRCKLSSTKVLICVKDDAIVVFTYCPLGAMQEDRMKVAEFIIRVNYGLMHGNFEMDFRDGEIRYKTVLPSKSVLPGMDDVEKEIDLGFLMMDRYGSGLAKLVMGYGEPEELIEECNS